ncbi:hypothetical protein [Agrobacterium sp. S7/73]|uniref:DUF4376 domain-containing protein n=1 Tax=Agrobacterium sp. S7/73 TaxID=2820002 RepID=UPI001C5BE23C|nr:hypothetical protein [Agrobacterium sp. S7/73]QXZ71880.1 hypothetical protein J5276_12380 [Agrobacterium sp. S7/73]QXZ74668.1 hypothetical protein J5276_18995 [Agrobacterium sp. S7/73]
MKYVLVQDSKVLQIFDVDPKLPTREGATGEHDPAVLEAPDAVDHDWVLKGNELLAPAPVDGSLDAVKAARVEVLRAACEATIIGGFASSALGNPHTYPSDIKAQINLMGSVTDSLMPDLPADWATPFWVCDAVGAWAWKMHNAAQIQQAGRNGKAHVVKCQTLLGELTMHVLAATTAEAVASIVWPEGGNA